jgi:hypothetical protein
LDAYIAYLERKHRGKIMNLFFRRKDGLGKKMPYILTLYFVDTLFYLCFAATPPVSADQYQSMDWSFRG